MSDGTDLSIEILKQIRDEMRMTRQELGAKIEQTNTRLDRVVNEQIRHATAIVELERGQGNLERGQVAIVAALERLFDGQEKVVGELRRINARIDNVLVGPMGESVRDHDARVTRLETRVEAIEHRIG